MSVLENFPENSLILVACISEMESLRYTPAGVPALNIRLEHESQVIELGEMRKTKVTVNAIALGVLAETLGQQELGSRWKFKGFLNNSLRSKLLVFHIQEFVQN